MQYIGDKIVARLRERPMADYRVEEFAPPRGDVDQLARAERNLRASDLRRLYDWTNHLVLAVTCRGLRFADVRDEFLMLYPVVAGAGARRGVAGPVLSKGLQKVLFACLEAVDRPPAGAPDGDRARGENLVVFQRFLEAFLQYRAFHGG
ncbi:MAG: type III-A CRISPR-associated protein Csm2 [Planctomycetes bacterium]|nr:type III-A CRISPR-associated protein Csm2 [Planctomycetota bacterium]